jgi:hypothetical protein
MVAGTPKIPTHTSEVAIADLSDSPSSSVNAGTMITPPPIPSSPDSSPATSPIPAASHRRRGVSPGSGLAAAPASLAASPAGGVEGATAVRQAVKARRTAMRRSRRWPPPGTAWESRDPPTTARRPAAAAGAIRRQSIRRSRR